MSESPSAAARNGQYRYSQSDFDGYAMLCTGEVWNQVDLYKIDMHERLKG